MIRTFFLFMLLVLGVGFGEDARRELSASWFQNPTPETSKSSPADAQDKQSEDFKIRFELESRNNESVLEYDTPFRVLLINESDRPIRIWSLDSEQGWNQFAIDFVNLRTGKKHVARRRDIVDPEYWKAARHRREPKSGIIEIEPKRTYEISFNLSDFAWGKLAWVGLPSPNTDERFLISIHLDSKPTDDSRRLGLWTGTLASEAVRARFAADKLKTPHQLLWYGFADAAVEMMAKNPAWVNKLDEDSRIPLHVAARFGPASAVQWLLDHGADVNAVAYNGFTPLHLTSDPEIVRLILSKKPDLSIQCSAQSRTPLQRAVGWLTSARTNADRAKWRRVVDEYRKAGAEIDAITAIHLDDPDRVKEILKQSPKLADDYQGRSLLREAAKLGRLGICEYLIKTFKVDVDDFERGTGYPIIKEAVAYPRIVKLLIDHGADLKTRITWRGGRTGVWIIKDDATVLHFAARDGVPETITLLLDKGVDPFAVASEKQQVALDVAAFFGKGDNAAAIVKHPKFASADAKIRQPILDRCLCRGVFPTWLARNARRLKLVEILLEAGADPNAAFNGATAMQIAARAIHPNADEENAVIKEIVALLRKHGASLDFFSAVAVGDIEQVRAMLAKDSKLANTLGYDGYPALHFAIGMDDREMVSALLAAGCDVNLRNKSDYMGSKEETPLHSAAFWGRPEIAAQLTAAKADVNSLDEHRSTPLHNAARLGNLFIAKLLVKNGAKVDARDYKGKTPLDYCQPGFGAAAEVRRFLEEAAANSKR